MREMLCNIFTGFAVFQKNCFTDYGTLMKPTTYIVLTAVCLSKACVEVHVGEHFSLIHSYLGEL
jgi:hypothetical protein